MFSKDLLLHREGSIYTGPYVSRIFLKLFGHHPVFPAPTVYSSAFSFDLLALSGDDSLM